MEYTLYTTFEHEVSSKYILLTTKSSLDNKVSLYICTCNIFKSFPVSLTYKNNALMYMNKLFINMTLTYKVNSVAFQLFLFNLNSIFFSQSSLSVLTYDGGDYRGGNSGDRGGRGV